MPSDKAKEKGKGKGIDKEKEKVSKGDSARIDALETEVESLKTRLEALESPGSIEIPGTPA